MPQSIVDPLRPFADTVHHQSSEPDPSQADDDRLGLAQHVGWVRKLAHTLVRDASAADVSAQDALVAAMESPTVRPVDARSGLSTVLHNRVRGAERRRGARERRELDAARPDCSGDFDELE